MKRFTFRFDAVLRQREQVLETRMVALAEVERKRALAVDLLAQRRQAVIDQQAGPGRAGAFDARHELVRQRYLHALRAEIRRREQQLVLIESEVTAARQAVAEAHQGVRAMELLRERDERAWQAELRRSEERENDERNAQRFSREAARAD